MNRHLREKPVFQAKYFQSPCVKKKLKSMRHAACAVLMNAKWFVFPLERSNAGQGLFFAEDESENGRTGQAATGFRPNVIPQIDFCHLWHRSRKLTLHYFLDFI